MKEQLYLLLIISTFLIIVRCETKKLEESAIPVFPFNNSTTITPANVQNISNLQLQEVINGSASNANNSQKSVTTHNVFARKGVSNSSLENVESGKTTTVTQTSILKKNETVKTSFVNNDPKIVTVNDINGKNFKQNLTNMTNLALPKTVENSAKKAEEKSKIPPIDSTNVPTTVVRINKENDNVKSNVSLIEHAVNADKINETITTKHVNIDVASSTAKNIVTTSKPIAGSSNTSASIPSTVTPIENGQNKSLPSIPTNSSSGKSISTTSTTPTVTTTTTTSTTTTTTTPTTTTTTTTPKPKKPSITYSIEDVPSLANVPKKSNTASKLPTEKVESEEPLVQPSQELDFGGRIYNNRRDYILPIVAMIFVAPIMMGIIIVSYRKFKEYWSTRHYRRMDFLVDGMYND